MERIQRIKLASPPSLSHFPSKPQLPLKSGFFFPLSLSISHRIMSGNPPFLPGCSDGSEAPENRVAVDTLRVQLYDVRPTYTPTGCVEECAD
jgi:hypothetical protein